MTFRPRACRSGGGEGGRGIHGSGKISEEEVVLEEVSDTTRKMSIGSTATRSAPYMWCAAGIYP
jgi:hypothetical protein